jgi:hypothetical protein
MEDLEQAKRLLSQGKASEETISLLERSLEQLQAAVEVKKEQPSEQQEQDSQSQYSAGSSN